MKTYTREDINVRFEQLSDLPVDPSNYMFMGEEEAELEGVKFTINLFKHYATRNYLKVAAGAAWGNPEGHWKPIPLNIAITHAETFGHKWTDGCVA